MQRRELVNLVVGLSTVCAVPSIQAESIDLLAVWDAGVIVGSQEIYATRWPAFIYLLEGNEFRAPLFEEFPLEGPFPLEISNTVSAANDLDFLGFVELLTDGTNQNIAVIQWTESGHGAGGGGSGELTGLDVLVPRLGWDLTGYTIDHITQNLIVNIESPGSDPFGDGLWTDWSVSGRYEFYGAPVPEPTTLAILLFGAMLMRRVRKIHR